MAIIAVGLLSRRVPLGNVLWDKYMGDVLYAAMVCSILGRYWAAALVMVVIECFQLTGIPAGLLTNDWWALRMLARLLGTTFSFLDLAAYGVGIAGHRALAGYFARRGLSRRRWWMPGSEVERLVSSTDDGVPSASSTWISTWGLAGRWAMPEYLARRGRVWHR